MRRHRGAQPVSDRQQQLVAGGMSERIVDVLEMVEVDVQERHVARIAGGALDEPGQQLLQIHAVWQPGQHVAAREPGELPLLVNRLASGNRAAAPAAVHHREEQKDEERKANQQCHNYPGDRPPSEFQSRMRYAVGEHRHRSALDIAKHHIAVESLTIIRLNERVTRGRFQPAGHGSVNICGRVTMLIQQNQLHRGLARLLDPVNERLVKVVSEDQQAGTRPCMVRSQNTHGGERQHSAGYAHQTHVRIAAVGCHHRQCVFLDPIDQSRIELPELSGRNSAGSDTDECLPGVVADPHDVDPHGIEAGAGEVLSDKVRAPAGNKLVGGIPMTVVIGSGPELVQLHLQTLLDALEALTGLVRLDRGKAVHEDEPRGGKYHPDQCQRGEAGRDQCLLVQSHDPLCRQTPGRIQTSIETCVTDRLNTL